MKSHFPSQITCREDGQVRNEESRLIYSLPLSLLIRLFVPLHSPLLFFSLACHCSLLHFLLVLIFSRHRWWILDGKQLLHIEAFVKGKLCRFYIPLFSFLKIFQIWRYTLCFIFVLDLTLFANDTPSALCLVTLFSFLMFFRIWRYTHHCLFDFCFGCDFACK